jgi:hypothetical protein
MSEKEQDKLGMYEETPRIKIGCLEICEFRNPPDGTVWIENETGEGAQFNKTDLEPLILQFYNKHF